MTRRGRSGDRGYAAQRLAHLRGVARRINAREPEWEVMFGPSSWLFWAFPVWPAPRGLILSDPDPAGLLAQMRRAEAAYGRPPRARGDGAAAAPEPPSRRAVEGTVVWPVRRIASP